MPIRDALKDSSLSMNLNVWPIRVWAYNRSVLNYLNYVEVLI